MTQTNPSQFRDFLAPKYWPTWLGIGLLCLIAWLPFRLRMAFGTLIGLLSYQLARQRRYIVRTNIDLCFPELNLTARENMVRRTFIAYGIGLIETGFGWVRNAENFRDQLTITGLEIMENARAQGRGVLMLGAHYSTLDFAANLLSITCPFGVTYRPHNNPLFDMFMQRGRKSYSDNAVFDRNDIRGVFRHLKNGGVLWYAPDQDYGPEHAVYAPFFGNRAATITIPARFAAVNDSPVVFVRHHRREPGPGYELEFTAMDPRFPSGDDILDASLINTQLERDIRHYPHQYLWLHKRFKTQPGGKPDSPYINIKTPRKTLSRTQLTSMTAGAKVVEEHHSRDRILRLANGLHMRIFATIPGRIFKSRHPAILFDKHSKQLRMKNIDCVTPDNIFMVPKQGLTAVTYFAPNHPSLQQFISDTQSAFPVEALAKFFADLHQHGFLLNHINLKLMLLYDNKLSLMNPEQISVRPTSLCYIERCSNLGQLFQAMMKLNPGTVNYFSEISTLYSDLSGLKENKVFLHELDKLSELQTMLPPSRSHSA